MTWENHHGRMAPGDSSASLPGLRRELNLFDVTAIVVSTIIGSLILLIPSFIAAQLKSLGAVLVWVVGGILTVFGALSLSELAQCTLAPAVSVPTCGTLTAGCPRFCTRGGYFS